MNPDLEQAVQIYLGATPTGAIRPGGGWDRLEKAYGARAAALKAEVEACMDPLYDPPPDWSRETYDCAIERVRDLARRLYPQFSETTINALANRFSFDWK